MLLLDKQFKIKKEHVQILKDIQQTMFARENDATFTRKEVQQIQALWNIYPIDAWCDPALGIGIIKSEEKIMKGLRNKGTHIKFNILIWVMQLPVRPKLEWMHRAVSCRYSFQRIVSTAYTYKR